MMSTILEFPKPKKDPPPGDEALPPEILEPLPRKRPAILRFLIGTYRFSIKFIWVVTTLFWPFIKWPLSVYTFYLGLRVIYYWDDPSSSAGWIFAGAFLVLTALTYFVSAYEPKDL